MTMTTSDEMLFSCSAYQSNVFKGFTQLQQSDEFVDMTLAAEGHLVKVHKMLVSLASPYLKELLQSVPCQHPIIFLNGVTNEVLGFVLEYIYSGEVQIPTDKIPLFLKTAQALHIRGLNNNHQTNESPILSVNMATHGIPSTTSVPTDTARADIAMENENNYNLQLQEPITDLPENTIYNQSDNYILPFTDVIEMPIHKEENHSFQNFSNPDAQGKTIKITLDKNLSNDTSNRKPVAKIEILSNTLLNPCSSNQGQLSHLNMKPFLNLNNKNIAIDKTFKDETAFTNQMDISQSNVGNDILMTEDMDESDLPDNGRIATINTSTNLDGEQIGCTEMVEEGQMLYTASNRGGLQLILDRFMYYCHYQRDDDRNGHKRRWRCIDYRDLHCQAAVDTVGEQMKTRKNEHCHPNHDEKIRKKVARGNFHFFPSIETAEDFMKQKEETREKIKKVIVSCENIVPTNDE